MREDSREVRQETLVDGEESFRANRLGQAVEDTAVEVAVLVVQTRHDGIWRTCVSRNKLLKGGGGWGWLTRGVHDNAHDEAANRAAGQMQRRALFHTEMLHQPSLREKVRRQLH